MKKLLFICMSMLLVAFIWCTESSGTGDEDSGDNGRVGDILEESGPRPEWPLADARNLVYVGIGRGSTLDEAYDNAAADIYSKVSQSILVDINAQLQTYIEVEESDLSSSVNTQLQQTIDLTTRSVVDNVYIGTDLFYWARRSAEDGDYYVYEAYAQYPKASRQEALERVQRSMQDKAVSANTNYESAMYLLERGRINQAFELLIQSKNTLEFLGNANYQLEGEIPSTTILKGEVEAMINQIQSSTQASEITGNNQVGTINGSLMTSISAVIQYEGNPFAGLHVEYSVSNDNAEVSGDSLTDVDGRIELHVSSLSTVSRGNVITASFFYEDNYGERYPFNNATAEWFYDVIDSAVGIVVLETYVDEDGNESFFQDRIFPTAISQSLTQLGFNVFEYSLGEDIELFNRSFTGNMQAINEIASERGASEILLCKVYCFFSSYDNVFGMDDLTSVWYKTDVEMKILDLSTGTNLFECTVEGDDSKAYSIIGDGSPGSRGYSSEVAHQRARRDSMENARDLVLECISEIDSELIQ